MLAVYVHNISPFIFQIWNGVGPRWYGFAYLMGFLAAYFLVLRFARQGFLRMPPEKVPDLVLNCCIFGVLIGGRLGYCLFYDLPNALHANATPLLWSFSSEFPFWGALKVWQGGMSAHGGVIGTVLVLIFFARKHKLSILNVGDAACMVVPLGLLFGRIANFINGELYGRPVADQAHPPWWAVKFPSEILTPTNERMNPHVAEQVPGMLTNLFDGKYNLYSDHGYSDALKEFAQMLQHHNARALEEAARILPARHPSQLYEALFEGLFLFLICWFVGHRFRKDGMAAGAFLTFYPLMRISGEYFRVGDTPADYLHIGFPISLGVLYSLPMFLVGLCLWIYWARRKIVVPPTPKRRPLG